MRRADGLMLPAVGFDIRSIQDEPDVRRDRKRSVRCPAGLAAVLRKPGPDALRGDTRGRQYRVAVPGVVVADPEQDVFRIDALAAESAGLFPGPGKHRAGVLIESCQHGRPGLRLARSREMPHT